MPITITYQSLTLGQSTKVQMQSPVTLTVVARYLTGAPVRVATRRISKIQTGT